MNQEVIHDRPDLLMLCHVLPDACGTASQQRAWRLLQQAATGYRVSLVCRVSQAIHLRSWQAVQAMTCRFHVEPASAGHRLTNWLSWRLGRSGRWGRSVDVLIWQWHAARPIQSVWVTDVRWLDIAGPIQTDRWAVEVVDEPGCLPSARPLGALEHSRAGAAA